VIVGTGGIYDKYPRDAFMQVWMRLTAPSRLRPLNSA
jgi:hypothetical protein